MSAMSSPTQGQTTGGSFGELHVDLKPIDNSEVQDALRTAAETACQLATQQISQQVAVSHELLIYPEGGVDAVTITDEDVEGLQPGRFLSDNVIDFYIRFLERGLSPEQGIRFFFFNSFFFPKLLQSSVSTGIDPCKVDYEQVREWTREVDLFAKDYIFIPIGKSSHWSLVIICHLSNLCRPRGEMPRSPCVVHLDPIEGQHESFESLIRSYVFQAGMERFQGSSKGDQLLALCQMKYVEAKVPEQDNGYDCGLHVLHYIEAFLVKSASPDFSFPSSEMDSYFGGPDFLREVLCKRKHIEDVIRKLTGKSQELSRKRRTMEWVLQFTENLRSELFPGGNFEACMMDVQTTSTSFSSGQGLVIKHASTTEQDALDPEGGQSSLTLKFGDNEPLNVPHIRPMEHVDRSESFSAKQPFTEREEQIGGSTHLNASICVAKDAFTHADALVVGHEQAGGMMSSMDGRELPPVENEGVREDNMLHHPACEEARCLDFSDAEKGKNKRGRNMTPEETWVLLSCMVEGGRFCKGSGARTNWDLICEEIGKKSGSWPSADQCRLRYDTLLKAYKTYRKYCVKEGKTFSEITKAERLELKLATSLSEDMYRTMEEIDEIHTKAKTCGKRVKLSSNVWSDLHPLDSVGANPTPMARGSSFEDEIVVSDGVCGVVEAALRTVLPASVLSSLTADLQLTLLNLVQVCCFRAWDVNGGKGFLLEEACRRLAILQHCERREIMKHIFELWKLNFVCVVDTVFEELGDLGDVEFWDKKRWFVRSEFGVKIFEQELSKNPQFQIYCGSYPMEPSLSQCIRVLQLWGCEELEHLDLSGFPSLLILSMRACRNLKSVTGWEVPTCLALLEMSWSTAYLDFFKARYLLSLREIELFAVSWQSCHFSQWSKLQRLEIWCDDSLSEVADLESLKELKFLEFLAFGWCSFSSIQGLSGLQALRTLKIWSCIRLRSVEHLGCLKALTHLKLSCSGVQNVVGVQKLHLLTSLCLKGCTSLEWLPSLRQLKALVHLDLRETSIKKIPGRQYLINLKTLNGELL